MGPSSANRPSKCCAPTRRSGTLSMSGRPGWCSPRARYRGSVPDVDRLADVASHRGPPLGMRQLRRGSSCAALIAVGEVTGRELVSRRGCSGQGYQATLQAHDRSIYRAGRIVTRTTAAIRRSRRSGGRGDRDMRAAAWPQQKVVEDVTAGIEGGVIVAVRPSWRERDRGGLCRRRGVTAMTPARGVGAGERGISRRASAAGGRGAPGELSPASTSVSHPPSERRSRPRLSRLDEVHQALRS